MVTANTFLLAFIVLFSFATTKNLKSSLATHTSLNSTLHTTATPYICPTPDFRPDSFISNLITQANKLSCNSDRKNLIVNQIKNSTIMIKAEDVVKLFTQVKICDSKDIREIAQVIDPFIFRLAPEQLKTILQQNDNKRQQTALLDELSDCMSDASQATKDLLISVMKCKPTATKILEKIKPRDCLVGQTTKNEIIVIDYSYSMYNEFVIQYRAYSRLDYVKPVVTNMIDNMKDDEKFNIIKFSSYAYKFKPDFINATSTNKMDAYNYVENLEPSGYTNIWAALKLALDSKEKDYSVLFITDGYPTEGETNYSTIIKNVQTANNNRVTKGLLPVKVNVNLIMLGYAESYYEKQQAIDFGQKLAATTGGVFKNFSIKQN